MCRGTASKHVSREALWGSLREALRGLGFPKESWPPGTDRTLTWYRATRHSFASAWILADRSLEKLSKVLGHASVTITEHAYVHLRRDLFSERDLATIALDLRPDTEAVSHLSATPRGRDRHERLASQL